jgi:hypothetical protein
VKNLSLPSALLLAALTVTLTSCSRNPVAPDTGSAGQPGTTTTGVIEQDAPPPTEGGTPNTMIVPFVANEEGVLTAGRWKIWVRKNTIKNAATIKLSVADPEAMECQIEVSPPEANDFQGPVIVSCDLSDVPNIDWGSEWMYYWDAAWNACQNFNSRQNEQNVVGHFGVLPVSAKVGPGDDKWKNK